MPRISGTIIENQAKPSLYQPSLLTLQFHSVVTTNVHDGPELLPQIITIYHNNKVSLKNQNQRKIKFYCQLFWYHQ